MIRYVNYSGRSLVPTGSGHSLKAKITVTLSADLLFQLETFLDFPGDASRSRAAEEAIRSWLSNQTQEKLESQKQEYYLSFPRARRKEDKQWSKIAALSAKGLWR